MESSTPWSKFGSFRHVEEVVSCDDLLGQLGDPFWVNIKSCLGPLPCLGEALSGPPEDPLVILIMEVHLLSFLPKSNPTIQG